ncbi:sigma-54-dependent Fis family transcriptional regulator [Planctomycetales bacterium]|nr:sigma-54-dependent Fis family transcriptional regulator [Planctomycetales bacterium]
MQSENAYLIQLQDNKQSELFRLNALNVFVIGRAVDSDIVLLDDRCSRKHARVFYENGHWFVQDISSRNGTLVNDEFIGQEPYPLEPSFVIQFGHSIFQFCCDELDNIATEPSIPEDEKEYDAELSHSGVFGIPIGTLSTPAADEGSGEFGESSAAYRTGHTSILRQEIDGQSEQQITTRLGYGAAALCRLAFQLGISNEIDQIAKTAIEGLLNATGAEGAGLWLFPYKLNSPQQATDIRLVANATLENLQYKLVSESLVRTIFEKEEAILFYEVPKDAKKGKKYKETERHHRVAESNTLAAPIRHKNGILGLIHLYTVSPSKHLEESDLQYTLEVADTVGTALTHINKQKQLSANLKQARSENSTLREMLQQNSEIVGTSDAMRRVHILIARAAEGKIPLLIRGESGSGKELVARAVHFASTRSTKPLVCLNCAAVPETLLASELFGHEKGAFTGATERKIGKFEAADSGTLFLDEIGEMAPELQAKLLRVLESSSFERVGGNGTITVDVRIMAATNRDIEKEVAEGRFRHDLFFRLRVLEILVPPLRKRPDDIPVLANYFLQKYSQETGRKYEGFDPAAMLVLANYRWPGNVRELKNVVERAVLLGAGMYISEQDLLLSNLKTTGDTGINTEDSKDVFIPLSLEDVEKNHVIRTLEHYQWNKSLAAKQLGIERTTLDRKISRYGLDRGEKEKQE